MNARQTKRVDIIYNPTAGGRKRDFLNAVVARLDAAACTVKLLATEGPGHATQLVKQCDGDVLAVAGGDGTINEVANGIGEEAPTLALIPVGTANVLAREIGLPIDVDAVTETILDGIPRTIHFGAVNNHRFVQMAGVGFDAQVVASTKKRLKKRIGKGAYVWETFRQIWGYRFQTLTLDTDAGRMQAKGIIIANGARYGGSYIVAPDAVVTEKELHLCCLQQGNFFTVLGAGVALMLNRLGKLPSTTIVPVTEIQITSPENIPIQADGDFIGYTPATIKSAVGAAHLLYPKGS